MSSWCSRPRQPKMPLPFTYDGRPYQRIGTTTSVMPQERYQELLLRRVHSRRRWENEAADVPEGELDSEEILRTSRLGTVAGFDTHKN